MRLNSAASPMFNKDNSEARPLFEKTKRPFLTKRLATPALPYLGGG